MKKLLLLLLMVVTSVFGYAQKRQPATAGQQLKSVADTVGKMATRAFDSTKSAVSNGVTAIGNGINSIDTSRVSKEMYHDFRNGVIAMAEALKTGVEHVYKILVIQQYVHSIVYILIVLILVIVPLTYFKRMRLWASTSTTNENGAWIAWVLCSILPLVAGFILFVSTATTIVTGFVNPEYGAMKDIVNMAQQIRNNPTQCTSCN